jgi:glycosyltransferase involved in cell wall biosynthesis
LLNELYQIFKKEKIDISISYTIKPNIYSAIAAYLTGVKSIVNLTGLGYVFLQNNFANNLTKKLYKFSLSLATKIIFQNKHDKNLFEKNKISSPLKAMIINGSGINTEKFKSSIPNKINTNFVFLFVGRLLYDKGYREFVKAAKKLNLEYPSIQFHLVGAMDEGNPSAVSQQELNANLEENSQLNYLGNQSNVIPFIQSSDVVVLPSYREGIPRVLLEAMSLEKPFVTVNSPGCEDVTIDGKNGLLAQVENAESLFEKMKEIYLLDAHKRQEMGTFGRKLVLEIYDEKIIVSEYLKLILSLS